MAHRGQWSEHEARGVLSAWRKSGQSIERFAKERGIVPQRIRWWKSKLEGSNTALVRTQSPLALLPVQVTEPAPPKRGEPVAVYLRSGHIVKVGRGFDEEPRHPPKSPISTAIRYALNQWRELGRFLDDARVPLDSCAVRRATS